jgi:ABC-type oligopeptide transport system substrate-binding subunit
MQHIKVTTIALALAFALSSPLAFAKTVRHKPSIATHDLHRVRPGFVHPNYGNPGGPAGVSAGGYMWNGRSASEEGGG